jgi:hypothetical protein
MQRKVIAEMVNILASFIAACSYQFVIGAWRTKETGIGVVVSIGKSSLTISRNPDGVGAGFQC